MIEPIPAFLLNPILVEDTMPPQATMRDVVAQGLEYKHRLVECSARLEVLRLLDAGVEIEDMDLE